MIVAATRKKREQPASITLSQPAPGYIAVQRGEQEPELVRFGMKPRGAVRARGISGPASSPSEGVGAGETANSMSRRRETAGHVADLPAWQKRGLFKPGFTQGPRVKSAKLFTKGKV
jgi:hypothetical protein